MTDVQERGIGEKLCWIGQWCLILGLGIFSTSGAEILRYRDANGVITFTNIPRQTVNGREGHNQAKQSPLPVPQKASSSLMKQSERLARKYGLNPHLVQAIITVESNFAVDALSRAGAQGLMQLMPATSRAYGIRNPFDPEENLEGGIRHLQDLMELFPGELSLVLAAYNAGVAAVQKFQGIPPFSETQEYVQKVLRLYRGSGRVKVPRILRYTDRERGVIVLTDTPLYGDRREKLFSSSGERGAVGR